MDCADLTVSNVMKQSIGLKKLNVKDFHAGFWQQFSIPTYYDNQQKKKHIHE